MHSAERKIKTDCGFYEETASQDLDEYQIAKNQIKNHATRDEKILLIFMVLKSNQTCQISNGNSRLDLTMSKEQDTLVHT